MARKRKNPDEKPPEPGAPVIPPPPPGGLVRELAIEDEMKTSYLTYAMSVIVSRALPDVRDGLKPSQRRILVAMNDLNLTPRSKFRKCSKIAGDTMGNYHPHGDAAIYFALVRMAQSFSLRYPLVDGQGNYGSIDGDPPASMRYTEARLASPAMELLADLEQDTVAVQPNYDDTRTEPTVLPARFPNLLCNGSSGIAVGMATSIPPHNLNEVCDALAHLIESPDATVDELAGIVKGPDFPTGGMICGRSGIVQAYRTGRGHITVRAKAFVEEGRPGRQNIVVTEIPFQVTKTAIVERIAELVKDGRLESVSDLRDESDKEGIRIVVEMKKGEEPDVLLNQLYEHTPLQDTFSIIMIALVQGRPRTLTLKEFLQHTIEHRVDVIRRRTQHLLKLAEARAHIVEGLKIALANIDAVVQTIKTSKSTPDARTNLMARFGLSEVQSKAILEMQLSRLTGLEQEKLDEEYRELIERISYYRTLLANPAMVLDLIKGELKDLKAKHGDARRTEIQSQEVQEFSDEELIEEEEMAVTVTHEGYLKRLGLENYRRQRRGGVGVTAADAKEGDFTERLLVASTHDTLLFFTSFGRAYWKKVWELPELARAARGRAIANLLSLSPDEKLASIIPVREFDGRFILMVTEQGTVKKTALKEYSRPRASGIIAIGIDEGDRLVSAVLTSGQDDVVLATREGRAQRFSEAEARAMGRGAYGVRGIRLKDKDAVVGVCLAEPGASVLTVCEKGYGKRTEFEEYRAKHRGGQGVTNILTTDRNGPVVAVLNVHDGDEVMLMTAQGMVVRSPVDQIREAGRATQGVRLMKLSDDDRIVAVARVVPEPPEEGAVPAAETPDALAPEPPAAGA